MRLKHNKILTILIHGVIASLLFAGMGWVVIDIAKTIPVAEMSALGYLIPHQKTYIWELNMNQALLDRNRIYCFIDYYRHLLKVFPSVREANGILGYLYYELGDEGKAAEYFEHAIKVYPHYFWNYYDLAIIRIHQGRYLETKELLEKALQINGQKNLSNMYASYLGYAPLLREADVQDAKLTIQHLHEGKQTCNLILELLNHQHEIKDFDNKLKGYGFEVYAF